MNRIVREHYPVADLPDDLRRGFPGDAVALVTVELEMPNSSPAPTLKKLLSLRRPPYKTTEEIVEEVRKDRDTWEVGSLQRMRR